MPTRSAITAIFIDPVRGTGLEARTESGFAVSFDTAAAAEGGAGQLRQHESGHILAR